MSSGKQVATSTALKYSLFFILSIFLLSISLHFAYTNFKEFYYQSQHPTTHPRNIHLKSGLLDTRRAKSITYEDESLWFAFKKAVKGLFAFAIQAPSMTVTSDHEKNQEKHTFMFHLDHKMKNHFEETKQHLEKLGVKIGHYIPHNTIVGTATMAQAKKAKNEIKTVLWVGEMQPENKLPQEQLLRSHLDKHARIAANLDAEFDSNWEQKIESQKEKIRQELHGNKQGRKLQGEGTAVPALDEKDVEFYIHASVAKHESKEALLKEVHQWEELMQKDISGLSHISLVVPSSSKIALGVHGKDNALKVAKWLSSKGLVHWVEVKPPTITHNKYAAMLMQSFDAPYSRPMWTRGLTGKGQRIGVGDTGCDYYHCFYYDPTNKPPFQKNQKPNPPETGHRKFIGFWGFMDTTDSPGGHGTHVTGSASANPHPELTNSVVQEYSAIAKDSMLAFLDCGCDTDGGCPCPADTQCECDLKPNRVCPRKFGVVYLPLDLNEGYFPWFYSKGVRVASNSWGTGYYKDFNFGYSTSSAEIDQFVWNHKDFLPVFAAGNSGGQFGYASLTSESESKNALVVGASMSSLESFQQTANFTDYTRIVERIKAELFQTYCLEASTLFDRALCEQAKVFDQSKCCNDGGKCAAKGGISSSCCGVQDFDQFPTIGFRCCPQCIEFEMAQQPDHFSPNNLALFTARGPTLDGRVKPDIVTVGDKVLSARSRGTTVDGKCNRAQNPTESLLSHEGTSMAAPQAASSAIIVRQYFEDGFYPSGKPVAGAKFSPSAALIKAVLIHSAQQLTGYIFLMSKHLWWPLQYRQGHRFSLRQAYMQGFGRIELQKALGQDAGLYVPNTADRELSTSDAHSYCFNVRASKPFRATLVWSDAPSSPAANINLVNDLDLLIIHPSKKLYYGNGIASAVGQTREEADFLNNVEQILFTDTVPGHYQVIVRGLNVPSGKQQYAVVMSGDFDVLPSCPPIPAGLVSETQKYQNLSYAFGVLSVIAIPSLSLVALYFYIQYKRVTEGAMGYRASGAAQTAEGEYIQAYGDSSVELDDLRAQEEARRASGGDKTVAVNVVSESQ